MEKDAILAVREVAELLEKGRKTACTMVQQRVRPAFRARGQWRFRRADIDAWIAKQVTATVEEPRTAESRATEDAGTGRPEPGDEPVEH
jgi:excisionase family DNA binding protein